MTSFSNKMQRAETAASFSVLRGVAKAENAEEVRVWLVVEKISGYPGSG
jgi:hypothetical protein